MSAESYVVSLSELESVLTKKYGGYVRNAYILESNSEENSELLKRFLNNENIIPGKLERIVAAQRIAAQKENSIIRELKELESQESFGLGFSGYSYCGPLFLSGSILDFGYGPDEAVKDEKLLELVFGEMIVRGFSLEEIVDASWVYVLNNELIDPKNSSFGFPMLSLTELVGVADYIEEEYKSNRLKADEALDEFRAGFEMRKMMMENNFCRIFGDSLLNAYRAEYVTLDRAESFLKWRKNDSSLFSVFNAFQASFLDKKKSEAEGEGIPYYGVTLDSQIGELVNSKKGFKAIRYSDYLAYDPIEKTYDETFFVIDQVFRGEILKAIKRDVESRKIELQTEVLDDGKLSELLVWESYKDFSAYMMELIYGILIEFAERCHSRYSLNEATTRVFIRLGIVDAKDCYAGYDFLRPDWIHGLGNPLVDQVFEEESVIKARAEMLIEQDHLHRLLRSFD